MRSLVFASLVVLLMHPVLAQDSQLLTEDNMLSEPDYESEKLSFQRGSVPHYALAQYSLSAHGGQPAGNARDVQTMRKKAAAGSHAAQYRLGAMYAQGRGVAQDHAKARAWFLKAARGGNAMAQVALGVMSEQGRATTHDYGQARQWYLKAASQRFADAQFMLGLMYYQGKGVQQDNALARNWFRQAAAGGSAPAAVNLGWMCEYARGAQPDFECARRWYAKAAAQGDLLGQYDLGTLYYHGRGVPRDGAQAGIWLQKAAQKNYAAAQYVLGVMALDPSPGRDPLAAYQWFQLVKLARYPGATYNIEKSAAELTAEQMREADAWVERWVVAHPVH